MIDSYGDGWNGNVYTIMNAETCDVLVSGTLADGASGTHSVCLDSAVTCAVMYVGGGAYPSEIAYNVYIGDALEPASSGSGEDEIFFSPNEQTCSVLQVISGLSCTEPQPCASQERDALVVV